MVKESLPLSARQIEALWPRPLLHCPRQIGFTQEWSFIEKAGRDSQSGVHLPQERALRDSERKIFWLAQAEEWEQRALDETRFTSGNAISKVRIPRQLRIDNRSKRQIGESVGCCARP